MLRNKVAWRDLLFSLLAAAPTSSALLVHMTVVVLELTGTHIYQSDFFCFDEEMPKGGCALEFADCV